MIKKIFDFALLVLVFLVGLCFSFWFVSVERLKDEYVYTLKVNHLIFKNGKNNLLNSDLNNLLYIHANRYFNLRASVPKFFIKENDELFCLAFSMKKDNVKYKTLLVKPGLYIYLKNELSFCPFSALEEIKE